MKVTDSFKPGDGTLRMLACWFLKERPDLKGEMVEMTIEQEMWYRELLPPEYQTLKTVTFRGVPIKIT